MSERHFPYEKIPESLAAWHFSEADYRQLAKVDWVVTEKIHGANFAMRTDGNETIFAKRKEFLTDEEDFFGYHQMRPKLIDRLLSTVNFLVVAIPTPIFQVRREFN
jgi:hypothetical protein